MDLSVLLNVASIVASIAVGFGTFYVADKRARRSRWEAAKDTVLRDLSKSLSEGNIPPPQVILATIRSVLRSQNLTELGAVTLGEVADDLIRQITADPFLDAERRKKLQIEVLALKTAQATEEEVRDSKLREEDILTMHHQVVPQWFSSLAFVAGIVASLFVALGLPLMFRLFDWLKTVADEKTLSYIPLISVLFTMILALLFYLTRESAARTDREQK